MCLEKMCQPVVMMYIVSSLCLCILLHLFHKLWWRPRRIQNLMASRGIRGPSFRFLHGNTKEMVRLRAEAMEGPMELSHHVFPRVLPFIYSCINLYGTIYLNWMGWEPQLVVADHELVKLILNNKDGDYQKEKLQGHMKKLLGDGLITAQGHKWHKQRKLANHAFHADSLKDMTPDMIAGVEMMLQRWRNHEGKEIEVFQELKLLTSEIISRTAFGNNYLEGENIFNLLTKLGQIVSKTRLTIKIPLIGKLVKTSDDVEAERLERGIRDSIIKLIGAREERVMSGESRRFGSDFLGLLLSAYRNDDERKRISLDDLVDECKTFYLVGQETTWALLTWVIFVLAIHKDWQDKARKEVLELFGQNSNPNPHGIARLTTMGMIINETLRLYSPVVSIVRRVQKGARLGDVIVPADMNINISTMAIHHSTKVWGEDAHLFKPDRFAEGLAKATNNNASAFLPFGLGPRTCVGLNFAANETKIALSMILQRYEFTLSPNYAHSPAHILILCPQHGLQIILHKL